MKSLKQPCQHQDRYEIRSVCVVYKRSSRLWERHAQTCLAYPLAATMTFNGEWKVDRNENYEKFMEQMGERLHAGACVPHVLKFLEHQSAFPESDHCVMR